jgi:NAD dependent epimerase/dehydratase family enzyme
MKAIRDAAGVHVALPATRLMLEIGAFFMRTETELVLKSRWVVPKRLTDSGFEFQFPEWPAAAQALVRSHA